MNNSPEERGLRILSLDGGGVSVLSALNIVGQAMDRLKVANELPVAPRPCETFDFMSGTGMGAVAVILLGRLRLDTVSATKSFMEISERTFLSKKRFSRGSVFSAKVLEKVMGELVARHCGQADAKMLETDSSSSSCKVMVCASTAHALRAGIPTCIRTYVASANQGPDCTVVEAVRATTATPGVFKQAVIQEQGVKIPYVGGGLQCNNPTDLALREVSMLFPGRPISCVMSVGAGQLRSASIPNVKIYDALLPSKLAPALERIATDCERTHQDLARRFEHTKGVYFRFSTDQGMQDIDQYDAKRLSEVQAHTRNYLHDTLVTSRMDEAIHSINAGVGAVKITQGNIQPLREPISRIGRCPPPSRTFTGREDILDQMESYFSKSIPLERHLYVLYGLGGAGKTQLALKFIHTHKDQFWDVFYIDATSRETMSAGLTSLAKSAKAGNTPSEALEWLASQKERWLLVLNNADDTDLNLHQFFPECAHGDILITTRNQEMIAHTEGPESYCRVGAMRPRDALKLLLRISGADDKDETTEMATALVKDVGFFALAIVQSGAYMRATQCGMSEYFNIFRKARDRLLRELSLKQTGDYQLSVYASWEINYHQLTSRAAQLLHMMSFMHHEGISETFFEVASAEIVVYEPCIPLSKSQAATKAVVSDFLASLRSSANEWDPLALKDLISNLRAFSLLDFDTHSSTYSMHPLVQEWSRTMVPKTASVRECTAWILSLCVNWQWDSESYALRRQILPHLLTLDSDPTPLAPELADNLHLVYYEGGYAKEEATLAAIALQGSREVLGNEHPTTLACMHDLAWALLQKGSLEEAATLLMEGIDARKRVLGHEHPDTLASMHVLATTCRDQGQWAESEKLFLEVIEVAKRVKGEEHGDTVNSMGALALTYWRQGRLAEANELQVQVLEMRKAGQGADHPATLMAMHHLASIYEAQGELQEAESLMEQTVILRKQVLEDSHAHTQLSIRELEKIRQRIQSERLLTDP